MSAKHRLSKDQKRKAKLAERKARRPETQDLAYSGQKYQTDRWVPHVYQTESAIYEAIKLSGRRLTNDQVRTALEQLIADLRQGMPPLIAEDAPEVPFQPGHEVEFLIWNIRRHWRLLFEEEGRVPTPDLIGILRTLLHSIQAHASNTGPDRGYVHFLERFLEGRV